MRNRWYMWIVYCGCFYRIRIWICRFGVLESGGFGRGFSLGVVREVFLFLVLRLWDWRFVFFRVVVFGLWLDVKDY